jgi:hypothetical protein
MTGMTYATLIDTLTGGEGVMQSATIERSYNKSSFWHGTTLQEFFSDTEIALGFELEICASGIQAALGGSGNLVSVTATYEEVTNGVQMVPRYPGQEIPEDERTVKAYDGCYLILGTNITFAVSGRGTTVWGESEQGTKPGAVSFQAAQGTLTLTIPTDAKIERVSEGSTNDGEPDTWSGDVFYFEPNPGASTSHTIDLPTEIEDQIPTNSIHTISETYTMDGALDTNARRTINITAYPTN